MYDKALVFVNSKPFKFNVDVFSGLYSKRFTIIIYNRRLHTSFGTILATIAVIVVLYY